MRVVIRERIGEKALKLANKIRREVCTIEDEGYKVEKIILTEDEYEILAYTVWHRINSRTGQETLFSYPIEIENELASFIAAHGSKCIMDYINNY